MVQSSHDNRTILANIFLVHLMQAISYGGQISSELSLHAGLRGSGVVEDQSAPKDLKKWLLDNCKSL